MDAMRKAMRYTIITLTTDFGLTDGYVGAMKGVILSIAPDVHLVDISHQIAPGNVRQGAYVLDGAAPFFPAGTLHLVVVDPGVGSSRRAIAARTRQALFVAPDNGVLSLCLAGQTAEIRQLSNPRYHLPQVSATFQGRDLFASVAAHLAAGAAFDNLGPLVTDPVTLPTLAVTRDPDGAWLGEVWHVDHFGNLITNFRFQITNSSPQISTANQQPVTRDEQTLASDLRPPTSDFPQIVVEIAGRRIEGLARTYADRAPGELVALVGSSGCLEIAVRDGSAERTLNARLGDAVKIIFGPVASATKS
jgi:S-adenosyl-L-methionine hydrolase (adenosine-forming)